MITLRIKYCKLLTFNNNLVYMILKKSYKSES